MDTAIRNYLEKFKIGRKQSFNNLTLYPLLSDYSLELEYLLLDEALGRNLIEVLEKDSGGSVPELRVVNKSQEMVLILDGEELVGAKQNRIVNTTILVEANSTIVIPVSCVEHGRWSCESLRFHSENRMMPTFLREGKAEQVNYFLRTSGEFRADQGAIWDGIAEKANRMETHSPTGAMAAIYEKQTPSLEKYLSRFSPMDYQVGAVFMINGRVAGLDAFGKPDTFSKVFEKLLQSYALDAIDWHDPDKEYKAVKREVTKFYKAALSATAEARPSVGLGTDLRLESGRAIGFALVLDDQLLHVSVFARADGRDHEKHTSRMERYSRRRINRF